METLPPIYAKAAAQLGPMRTKVVDVVAGLNPAPAAILDLASGPGEPAISLAKRFSSASVLSTDSVANCEPRLGTTGQYARCL